MRLRCACGAARKKLSGPSGASVIVCDNCDTTQPSEEDGGQRVKTAQDYKFDLHWERRKND